MWSKRKSFARSSGDPTICKVPFHLDEPHFKVHKVQQEKIAPVKWYFFDAQDEIVGRLSNKISSLLLGKHKPTYDPSVDGGDYVVVVNAEKMKFTGKKWRDKIYYWHTGHPGGLKKERAEERREKYPDRILREAVMGSVPKNGHKTARDARLLIFNGPEHPFTNLENPFVFKEPQE